MRRFLLAFVAVSFVPASALAHGYGQFEWYIWPIYIVIYPFIWIAEKIGG